MSTSNLKVVSALAVLSYPHLDVPQKADDGKQPKYSCALVFTPELLADPKEKALFDKMKLALVEAINAKWPGKAEQLAKSEGFRKGIRYDAEAKGYPAGSIYVNVRSVNQPGVVYAFPSQDDPKKPAKMAQENIKKEMYPGVIVRASLAAFAYDNSGNKGVSFGLNNIQKIRDGERLDGRVAAENEFDIDLTQQPADLTDIL
jgi:hypothetical protein